MSNRRSQHTEERRTGISRDLPDQLAGEETDPEDQGRDPGAGDDVPDTDEAGSGPRRSGAVSREQDGDAPSPYEPTD